MFGIGAMYTTDPEALCNIYLSIILSINCPADKFGLRANSMSMSIYGSRLS